MAELLTVKANALAGLCVQYICINKNDVSCLNSHGPHKDYLISRNENPSYPTNNVILVYLPEIRT